MRILASLLLICSMLLANAQDIILEDNGLQVNGQTINVPISDLSSSLDKYLSVTNNTSGSLDIKVTKEIISEVSGSMNTVCWGVTCYPPFTMTTGAETIAAGEEYEEFHATYAANDNPGITSIKYTFFVDGTSIEAYVILNFDGTTSVQNENLLIASAPYPNPAVNSFNIGINKPGSEIRIFNILGKEVKSFKASESTLQVDCADWEEGIYFVRAYDSGKLKNTHKLIISR